MSAFVLLLALQAADPNEIRRWAGQGEQALAARRYEEAAAAYEKLKLLDPNTAEVHGRLGLVYFQMGRFAQALPPLRTALKLKPSLPNTDVLLAMCLAETGRLEESLTGLEKGFRRGGDAVLKRMSGLQLQRVYTGLRRDAKAAEVALELVKAYPDDPEVLYHSSRLFANFAYLSLRRLNEAAPDSVWRLLAAGETHESQGNHELALARYREVLAKDPARPGVHYRMGRTELARGDAAQARREFEQELEIDATNANAGYELGELHRKAGEHEHARRRFASALEHDAAFEEAAVGLGRALLALGKAAEAVAALRRAVTLNSGSDVGYFHLAQAYRALGDAAGQQKALAQFRRVREERAGRETVLVREVTPQQASER